LVGNVKFIGSAELMLEHLSSTSSKSIQNKWNCVEINGWDYIFAPLGY
jgi:hypothetical protein